MKKFLILFAVFFLVMILFILVRTFTFESKQMAVAEQDFLEVPNSSIEHLQRAIQFKTISYDDQKLIDSTAFLNFHTFLKSAYPVTFSKLSVENVNDLSMLLHWRGKNPTKQPIILMAHQDVVPVETATLNKWHEEPFSGKIKDKYIYGRGAIDNKGSLIAILESVELLLTHGFTPKNDIYFVFGHDEEVSGLRGAKAIAQLLKSRGIKPAMVLDEGGIMTENKVPGLNKTAAVVGIAEKGYLTLDLKINIPGGHSSMPEHKTAIDQIAAAIVKLRDKPFPAKLGTVIHHFMDYVGPEMSFVNKMAMANRWLFTPLIESTYSKSPAGNATIRTTTAFTIFNSGVKENLIPGEATATVNFRTPPETSKEEVINYVRKVIDNDKIEIIARPNSAQPKQIADVEHPTFKHLQKTISAFKKNIVVAPYLMVGASDSRYFTDLTTQVFRFIPFTDIEGLHGVNERISGEEFKNGISFYYYFIKSYKE
jgi:carboxypeptidase PM20D1